MIVHKGPVRQPRNISDDHLVVVDDLPEMRDLLRVMLKSEGYKKLTVAESGNLALRKITVGPPDLVITDWDMPNMKGIELLTQIKNDPKLFSIPVIIMSEERTNDKVLYAVEEGVDGFLIKPFNRKDLINNVKRALNKGTANDEMDMKIIEMRRLKLSKNYREALELGAEILKKGINQRVTMMMCDCLYQVEEYERAISMLADTGERGQSSENAHLLGKIHLTLGQYSQGLFALELAVKMNPLNNNRKIDLADAYIAAGRRAEAENIIQNITDAAPTDLELIRIAQIYLDLDEMAKAGQLLKQTVEPIKSTVHVFNNYAVALRQANRFEDAAEIYLKCLKIDPDSDVLYYNLAVLYLKIHKMGEAKEALTNAIKLNPDNQHARDLLLKCK